MKRFPTLYKLNSSGGVEKWIIIVNSVKASTFGEITTAYGELEGKLQYTSEIIKEGKNVGKKNETTAYEQAVKEAEAKYTKKLKSGYVLSVDEAREGKTDSIIEGGITPMLAKSFSDDGQKIIYPCSAQPKLDGIRCIAIKKGNNVSLWTRTRKPIKSCPHIIGAIQEVFNGVEDIILDGELYNHDLKADFERIVSAVRKDQPSEEAAKIEYHIYDIASSGSFALRNIELDNAVNGYHDSIKLVYTFPIESEEEVFQHFQIWRAKGYEGLMLRNNGGHYEPKRSIHLQKVKEFDDAEFEIVGVEEGRGKLAGNVGAYICKTADGKEFKAKPCGNQEATKAHFQNPKSVIGRLLTVKYQGMTGKNGVPRFPIGMRIRATLEGSIL